MASSSQSYKLDLMIEEGIKSKKIEALLAKKIHKISKIYEKEISNILEVSEDLSKLKNSKLRAQNLANYTYGLMSDYYLIYGI